MAAIGTGPTLSDERVRAILCNAIEGRVVIGGAGTPPSVHELARMAQEILDLRTAIGLLEAAARRDDDARDMKATGQRGSVR